MGRDLGPALPRELVDYLRAAPPAAKFLNAFVLTTVDADGVPRHALLSAHEVVAKDAGALLILLRPQSRSADNARSGRALSLLIVVPETSHAIAGVAEERAALDEAPGEALFDVRVVNVREDRLATARITSGITFDGGDPGETAESRHRAFKKLLEL